MKLPKNYKIEKSSLTSVGYSGLTDVRFINPNGCVSKWYKNLKECCENAESSDSNSKKILTLNFHLKNLNLTICEIDNSGTELGVSYWLAENNEKDCVYHSTNYIEFIKFTAKYVFLLENIILLNSGIETVSDNIDSLVDDYFAEYSNTKK